MTQDQKMGYLAAGIIFALFMMLLFTRPVKAEPCPADVKSCKVIVVTPEQEAVLDQLITQTCVSGPYAQIAELVKFYKDMVAKAPAGTIAPVKPGAK